MNLNQPCAEGVVLAGRVAQPCARDVQRWVLAATILGSSLAFIDGTVVNVALPALQRDLEATSADVQWVIEAYSLLFSALLLVGGALGDRFGRRRVFAIGVAIFALASAACGLAASVRQLVATRAIQGIGAALLVPGSLALISANFEERQRGRAIGTWSGFSAITTGLGPVLGGWLVEHFSWRWAFFLNLPVALAVLALALARVPESRDPDAAREIDWAGAALVTLGLGGLVYGLIESPRLGWGHPRIIAALAGGAIALVAFVALEARSRAPMLPLSLFRSRNFAGANLLTLLLYAALGGTFYFLPLVLIQVQGYSATAAGAVMLPFILIVFLLSRWSGGLVEAWGAKLPLVAGPAIAAAGFALLARPGIGGSYWTTFFPPIAVLGLGMAVAIAPLTTTVMNAVGVRHSGLASGVNNAVSRTAGLLSIAVLGVLVAHVFNAELDRRLPALKVREEIVRAFESERGKQGGAQAPGEATPAERAALRGAVEEAYVAAFRRASHACAGLALLGALAASALIEGRDRRASARRRSRSIAASSKQDSRASMRSSRA